jgi:hypothetical protein
VIHLGCTSPITLCVNYDSLLVLLLPLKADESIKEALSINFELLERPTIVARQIQICKNCLSHKWLDIDFSKPAVKYQFEL